MTEVLTWWQQQFAKTDAAIVGTEKDGITGEYPNRPVADPKSKEDGVYLLRPPYHLCVGLHPQTLVLLVGGPHVSRYPTC